MRTNSPPCRWSANAPRTPTLVGFVGISTNPTLVPDERQRARDDRPRPDRRRLLPLDARPRSAASATGRTRRRRWRGAARRGASARRGRRGSQCEYSASCVLHPPCGASRGAGGAGRGWCAAAASAACDCAAVGAAGGPGACSEPSALVPASAMVAMAAAPVACSASMPITIWPGRTRARRATRGATKAGSEAWWASVARARCSSDLTAEHRRRLAARELLVAAALELAPDQRGALRAGQALDRARARPRGARPARRPRRPTARRRAARAAAGPSASRARK